MSTEHPAFKDEGKKKKKDKRKKENGAREHEG